MAFRSAGSIAHLLRKLKGAIRGGRSAPATAQTPNVKVELDISTSHPKDVVRVTAHPGNYQIAKQLMAAAQPERLGFIYHLAQLNLTFATGELAVKVRRAFLKAKESEVNEAAKGILNNEVDEQLQYLLREAKKNSVNMKYLTEVVEYVAKHSLPKGVPPPPARPLALPKEGANGKNGNSKSEGNGGGANGAGGDLSEPDDFYGGF